MNDIISRFEFSKTTYYVFKDGALCINSKKGFMKQSDKCLCKNKKYRLYARRDGYCALPSTTYYLADVETGDVYETERFMLSILKELREYMKNMEATL